MPGLIIVIQQIITQGERREATNVYCNVDIKIAVLQ